MQYVKLDCVVVLLNISQGPALTTEYFWLSLWLYV